MFQSSSKKPDIKIPGSTPNGELKTDINDNEQAKKVDIISYFIQGGIKLMLWFKCFVTFIFRSKVLTLL